MSNQGTLDLATATEVLVDQQTGSVLDNAGTLDMTNSDEFELETASGTSPTLVNESGGTISYSGSGQANIGGYFTDDGAITTTSSGTLNLQSTVAAGTATFSGTGTIDGDTLQPSGAGVTVSLKGSDP